MRTLRGCHGKTAQYNAEAAQGVCVQCYDRSKRKVMHGVGTTAHARLLKGTRAATRAKASRLWRSIKQFDEIRLNGVR